MNDSYNVISKPEQLNNFTTINPVQPINMKIPDSYIFPQEISDILDTLNPEYYLFRKKYSDDILRKIENYSEALIQTIPFYGVPEHPEDCK